MQYFIIAIMAVLVLCAFVRKRARLSSALLLFLGAVIIVCCTNTPDMVNLQNRYDQGHFNGLAEGFSLLMRCIKALGFSFAGFKVLYMLATMIPVYMLYRKYTGQVAVACALFMIFPYTSFTGQIRNGLAAVIVMCALMWYITSKKKHSWIGYMAVVLLASTIHPSVLIYMVGLLAKYKISIKRLLVLVLAAAGAVLVALVSGLLYKLVSLIFDSPRVLQWFSLEDTTGNNIKIFLVVFCGQLLGTFTFLYVRRKMGPEGLAGMEQPAAVPGKRVFVRLNGRQLDALCRVNVMLLVILPFYAISPTFFRLYKYILIVDYIVFCQAAFTPKRTNKLLLVWVTVWVIFAGFMSEYVTPTLGNFLASFSFGNLFS